MQPPKEVRDMCMEISKRLLDQIVSDLGLNVPYVKGVDKKVSNCWHFYSDGNDVDEMFYGDDDFRDGMNRVFVTVCKYKVVILAFALMDTHFHFVLYGSYLECLTFINDYLQRTSQYIALKHGDLNKLSLVKISHQKVETEQYLKTVICYTIKNPTVGGVYCLPHNYPWSSGALYFAGNGSAFSWASCNWLRVIDSCPTLKDFSIRELRQFLHTKEVVSSSARVIDGLVFPGDYVAFELVEKLFRSYKSFQFFLSLNKEYEVESMGGVISSLSIPMQEMRQHKSEICYELYRKKSTKSLNTTERLKLARVLKSRYNSSVKQIVRLCGLNYDECKDLL